MILLTAFGATFVLSACLAPAVRFLGMRLGAMDAPGGRKIHLENVPRIGGLGILISFLAAVAFISWQDIHIRELLAEASTVWFLLAGAMLCFGAGLADDIHELGPLPKLALQIAAALSAWAGGIVIETFIALPFNLDISGQVWINLPLTIFWFLLLVNAVNLVDGLDGLAGGIALFTCIVMSVFLSATGQFALALFFAILGGSVAGFLPYNFRTNGKKLFLGDSGSYFLGYAIAAFSIMGSVKGQVGVALLIPLLAMSLPVFEVLFSPVRRIILARNPMAADSGHIHHHLLKIGFSRAKALLILYGLTLITAAYALLLIHIKSEMFGLFIILLGLGVLMFSFLKFMGYFHYIDREKCRSWLGDFSFVTGIARRRRRFLDLQISLTGACDMQELWEGICRALEELDMDYASVRLFTNPAETNKSWARKAPGARMPDMHCEAQGTAEKNAPECKWNDKALFRLDLPLYADGRRVGEILLVRDLARAPMGHHTLPLIEHFRRAIERNPMLRSKAPR